MSNNILIILLILNLKCVISQEISNCDSKETCGECIQKLGCVWCIYPNVTDPNGSRPPHCIDGSSVKAEYCQKEYLEEAISSFIVLEDRNLSSDEGDIIQMQPQRIKLSLRKDEEFALRFQYSRAKNYPVDLYYVMDLSASMEKHREKLGGLGVKLSKTMMNITRNFKVGFGSFVDKVALPFTNTRPESLEKPCELNKDDGSKIICAPPYSFKNHMPLTEDYKKFGYEVNRAKISGNYDLPEGGLDAIMQAMVCKDEIGWRPNARHLLVFSTDASSHLAGDGRLAGAVVPNDGKCHMENGLYKDFSKYDYPSISHINHVAKENNINIIFAIVKNRYTESNKLLSSQIENSNMGVLGENSENVIQLVIDNYNKIVDSVEMISNATNDIEVKFSSTCANPKEDGCSNIHVGEIVDFTATIKPLACSPDGSNKRIIAIQPKAMQDNIIIELDIICDCNCASPNSPLFEEKSLNCTEKGNFECGICNCPLGRYGRKCECDGIEGDEQDNSICKATNDSEVCSKLGTCTCGTCHCDKRHNPQEKIYGKFCECNNYSCPRERGVLCSGRGTCDCGRCKCHADWTGDSCDCPKSNGTCIAPNSNEICSGRGICDCGTCKCLSNIQMYSGIYCEECRTCPSQRCGELRNCVECQAYASGKYNKADCLTECTSFKTEKVERLDDEGNEERKKCTVYDVNECQILFDYTYDSEKNLIVRAYKEKLCGGTKNVIAMIAYVIGSILLAGLIMLIIWKIFTTIHDRREFAKFENERENSKWHVGNNPLYKPSTTLFKNPAFKRSFSNSSGKR